MDDTRDALWIASTALVVAALALSTIAPRQRHYRGWRFWVAALWLASGAALLGALGGRLAGSLAQGLLLGWPVLTLIGLRRFQPRSGWPGGTALDTVALAASLAVLAGAALVSGAQTADGVAALLAPAVAVAGLHLYVAGVLAASTAASTPVRVLAAAIALAGMLPALVDSWLQPGLSAIVLQVLAAAPAALVTAFTTLMMVSERSDRELRASRRRIRVLADLDALTRVPNRRRFDELARRAARQDGAIGSAVAMFDVDHFKLVNDRLGHAAGDRALCLVAACVQETLRAQDIAGRLGGDEFALLLRGADVASALLVAERIVERVQAQAAEHGLPLLSLSFGVVLWQAPEPMVQALARADRALYVAKRLGRSCAVTAHGDGDDPQFSESQRLGLSAS